MVPGGKLPPLPKSHTCATDSSTAPSPRLPSFPEPNMAEGGSPQQAGISRRASFDRLGKMGPFSRSPTLTQLLDDSAPHSITVLGPANVGPERGTHLNGRRTSYTSFGSESPQGDDLAQPLIFRHDEVLEGKLQVGKLVPFSSFSMLRAYCMPLGCCPLWCTLAFRSAHAMSAPVHTHTCTHHTLTHKLAPALAVCLHAVLDCEHLPVCG